MHLLCPAPGEDADGGPRSGFALPAARLVNRGSSKSVARAAWDKATGDGAALDEIGPENLTRCLEPLWPEDRPHVPVEELREWFASYVYLPRLRDEAVLDDALRPLAEDMAWPFALAAGFDEATGAYVGVVDGGGVFTPGDLGSRLLVRREAVPVLPSGSASGDGWRRRGDDAGNRGDLRPDKPPQPSPPSTPRPKRFFASLKLDPDRAGRDVARIMDGLLVELTRAPGSEIALTLEIHGSADEAGYPEDVVDTVVANARDLKLSEGDLGFEED